MKRSIWTLVLLTFAVLQPLSSSYAHWDADLNELHAIEAELALMRAGFPFVGLPTTEVERLSAIATDLSNADRQQIAASGSGDGTSGKGQAFFASLQAWYEANRRYHDKVDEYIVKKQAYIIGKAREELILLLVSMPVVKQQAALSLFMSLEDTFVEWFEAQDAVASDNPKERRQRLYAFHAYFAAARELIKMLELPEPEFTPAVTAKPKRFATVRLVCSVLWNALKAPFSKSPTKAFKFTTAVSRRYADLSGYQVEVKGRENLEEAVDASHREGGLTLILPSHRTTIGDAVLLANLKIENAIIFANTEAVANAILGPSKGFLQKVLSPEKAQARYEVLQQRLANHIADMAGMVAIGNARGARGLHAPERLAENLDNDVSSEIVNYFQGFVANFNEVLPGSNQFVDKLLTPLLARGQPVRVVAASYEIDSDFLEGGVSALAKGSEVKVHKAISPELVSLAVALEHKGMHSLFNMMVRAFWLDHITRFPELDLKEIDARMARRLHVHILPEAA